MDRRYAVPDPTLHVDANPDPVPAPNYTVWKIRDFFYFYSRQCQFPLFNIFYHRHKCHNFQYSGHNKLKFSG